MPTRTATTRTLFAFTAALLAATNLCAQTAYTAVDLTPNASGAASAVSGGVAAGYTGSVPAAFTGRATLWTGDGAIDLHPAFLAGAGARSAVQGSAADLQVGSGADVSTLNRLVALVWRNSAASAAQLPTPFANAGAQATATDGVQIVGSATPYIRDGTTLGPARALVWDAASGAVTDLGEGTPFDVRAGQQVGIVFRNLATAVVWQSTRNYTQLHPRNAVVSYANGTDGVRQVGYAGFDLRVREEATRGNKEKRFNFAHVWTGTAASALNIHPSTSSADGALLEHSYAQKVRGPWIVGHATTKATATTPARFRALVWNANYEATDLNAFLPPEFIHAQAVAIDEAGNIAGVMWKADGTRHAVAWLPNF
ncbi:MAG: hypothetical protein JSR82_20550 [Verrucomicrobia bacterium]|nr:hypothetical protein [Verrucomicrobiota bacterium]